MSDPRYFVQSMQQRDERRVWFVVDRESRGIECRPVGDFYFSIKPALNHCARLNAACK